jgi:hypothetical protein
MKNETTKVEIRRRETLPPLQPEAEQLDPTALGLWLLSLENTLESATAPSAQT